MLEATELPELEFLALFQCDRIPETLFSRSSRPAHRWNSNGELEYSLDGRDMLEALDFRQNGLAEYIKIAESENTVSKEGGICFHWYRVNKSWKEKVTQKLNSESMKAAHFVILGIVIRAFPERWSEIIWEEIQDQLLEVVESTCIPFLGVLNIADLQRHLNETMKDRPTISQYLTLLLKFLISISTDFKNVISPNISTLIPKCIELLRIDTGIPGLDLQYLELTAAIAEALRRSNNPRLKARELLQLNPRKDFRSNAAIGFALASLPPAWMFFPDPEVRKDTLWSPLSTTIPSTMEILASALLQDINLEEILQQTWSRLSFESKILITICKTKRQKFTNTCDFLIMLMADLESLYGPQSMEYLLMGTVLLNSYNLLGMASQEEMGREILENFYGSVDQPKTISFPQETYLLLAFADTLLGQGNYSKAEEILLMVWRYPLADSSIAVSAALRLLKLRRRTGNIQYSSWELLWEAAKLVEKVSPALQYEFLQESLCYLSPLSPDDALKLPQAPDIVKHLSKVCAYQKQESVVGPWSNFSNSLKILKEYSDDLNLSLYSGTQLSYHKKLGAEFPKADTLLVEKVGSANWNRFQRIKTMQENMQLTLGNIFHHSGQTSLELLSHDTQIDSTQTREDAVRNAGSAVSITLFLRQPVDGADIPPIPEITSDGYRRCGICLQIIEDVTNDSQWRTHAIADLRPYLCVIPGCDAQLDEFASRQDFAGHLAEHQFRNAWICAICGYQRENRDQVLDHTVNTHRAQPSAELSAWRTYEQSLRVLKGQTCPLCGNVLTEDSFIEHICRHLEEISFSVLQQSDRYPSNRDENNFTARSILKSNSPARSTAAEPHTKASRPSEKKDASSDKDVVANKDFRHSTRDAAKASGTKVAWKTGKVRLWSCCNCGDSGLLVSNNTCADCGHLLCPYCTVYEGRH